MINENRSLWSLHVVEYFLMWSLLVQQESQCNVSLAHLLGHLGPSSLGSKTVLTNCVWQLPPANESN